jgi:hypothetical protein
VFPNHKSGYGTVLAGTCSLGHVSALVGAHSFPDLCFESTNRDMFQLWSVLIHFLFCVSETQIGICGKGFSMLIVGSVINVSLILTNIGNLQR